MHNSLCLPRVTPFVAVNKLEYQSSTAYKLSQECKLFWKMLYIICVYVFFKLFLCVVQSSSCLKKSSVTPSCVVWTTNLMFAITLKERLYFMAG